MLASLSRILCSRNGGNSLRAVNRSVAHRSLTASRGNKDGTDDSPKDSKTLEAEDEYSIEGFEMDNDEDDLDSTVDVLSKDDGEMTPELASHLVDRMLEATKKTINKPRHGGAIIPYISPHTVSVMRASRITTNSITAAGSDYLPHAIEKKVTAKINIELLDISKMAQEALKMLSGSRWKGSHIKISCDHYPSMEENRVHIVSQIDRLIAAAKKAVGEEVDTTPLLNWSEVVREVQRQAKEEVKEAGNISLVLGVLVGHCILEQNMSYSSDKAARESAESPTREEQALQALERAARSIALSITSIVMSAKDQIRMKVQRLLTYTNERERLCKLTTQFNPEEAINLLESAGVQNEDELAGVLEKYIFDCLLASKLKGRKLSEVRPTSNQYPTNGDNHDKESVQQRST